MNKLVQYKERTVEQGFTFHDGWWGEFSPTGELVMVYAYPIVDIKEYDWSYEWKQCRIFYPFDGVFVGDLELRYKLPVEVIGDFDEVAKQVMLERKKVFYEIYGE